MNIFDDEKKRGCRNLSKTLTMISHADFWNFHGFCNFEGINFKEKKRKSKSQGSSDDKFLDFFV